MGVLVAKLLYLVRSFLAISLDPTLEILSIGLGFGDDSKAFLVVLQLALISASLGVQGSGLGMSAVPLCSRGCLDVSLGIFSTEPVPSSWTLRCLVSGVPCGQQSCSSRLKAAARGAFLPCSVDSFQRKLVNRGRECRGRECRGRECRGRECPGKGILHE